ADDAEPLSRVDPIHPAPTTLLLPPNFSVDPVLSDQLKKKDASKPLILPPVAGTYSTTAKQRRRALSERRPCIADRRNCILPPFEQYMKALDTRTSNPLLSENITSASDTSQSSSNDREMARRRVWVQRIGSSATLVPVAEDDLVDDLRDAILRKYNNTLGKIFDSPDLIIKVVPPQSSDSSGQAAPADCILQPDERIWAAIEKFFPGGQTVNDALIIDIPQRRTPRPSPRHIYYPSDEMLRPNETVEEYFPTILPQPTTTGGSSNGITHHTHTPPAMAVLTTGQLPNVPSPSNFAHSHRPRVPRKHTHTPSPSMMPLQSSVNLTTEQAMMPPQSMPISPPGHSSSSPAPIISDQNQQQTQSTQPVASQPIAHNTTLASPPIRNGSPRPHRSTTKHKKSSKRHNSHPLNSLLDGTVPPIEVLIVEDNIINLKLLEAFMKRLKVRWQTAMNGREAVTKWRKGGFHLVLMDIQLPVMNGLDATREIRRLERSNSIGVFSKSSHSYPFMETTMSQSGEAHVAQSPEDDLLDKSLFKSPVIIVALTASSLQSDRHEALAAGCNDFLTKPVNMVWLEQKVTEWGSMQALIDYEGWCKWRGFPQNPPPSNSSSGARSTVTSPGPTLHSKTAPTGDGISPVPEDPSLTSSRTTELAGAGLHENATGFPFTAPPTEHIPPHTVLSAAPRSPKHRHRLSGNSLAGAVSPTLSPSLTNAPLDADIAATLDPDSVSSTALHPIPTPSIEEVAELGAPPVTATSPVPRPMSASSGSVRNTHPFRTAKNRCSTPSNIVPQGTPPS
ncbi:ssk1 response regulator receiver, partial [Ascosphaera aggregata]